MDNDIKEYYPTTVYQCRFCGANLLFEEHAKLHVEQCIQNPLRFHGSTTDKNTKILIKSPKEGYSGYKDYRLLNMLGANSTLVVMTDDGYRELSEEEILTENKEGYEPLELDEELETMRSDLWQKQVDLVAQSVEQQREIGESIEDFWEDVQGEIDEMKESGVNGNDIAKYLKEKYKFS